ncbi:metal-dependent hydrolase [Halovenus halobia]|uniref:metal-dependent hydrolase n=1 Tax=Halovenus halobia TaxID=3396622 RepID=UPI003F57603B
MPSTLVHAAVAGLIGAALLGDAFDKRALLVVVVVVAIPDLDSFIALVSSAGHRTSLHNLAVPALAVLLWWVDVHVREQSLLRSRWGAWGVRVAWVAIVVYALGHVLLDLTDGYANLFWPLHDQFYTLRGEMELSNQRGLVQTFRDSERGFLLLEPRGTSRDVQITTGVDPGTTPSGETAERTFPLFGSGLELLVALTGGVLTAARLRVSQRLPEE